jgi:hypothetical protein
MLCEINGEWSRAELSLNGPLTVWRLLSDGERSLALIYLKGKNRRVANQESTARYMIISGAGTFTIGDGESQVIQRVEKGSVVTIPPNTPYQDEGEILMVSMNKPPFNPEKVVNYT